MNRTNLFLIGTVFLSVTLAGCVFIPKSLPELQDVQSITVRIDWQLFHLPPADRKWWKQVWALEGVNVGSDQWTRRDSGKGTEMKLVSTDSRIIHQVVAVLEQERGDWSQFFKGPHTDIQIEIRLAKQALLLRTSAPPCKQGDGSFIAYSANLHIGKTMSNESCRKLMSVLGIPN